QERGGGVRPAAAGPDGQLRPDRHADGNRLDGGDLHGGPSSCTITRVDGIMVAWRSTRTTACPRTWTRTSKPSPAAWRQENPSRPTSPPASAPAPRESPKKSAASSASSISACRPSGSYAASCPCHEVHARQLGGHQMGATRDRLRQGHSAPRRHSRRGP